MKRFIETGSVFVGTADLKTINNYVDSNELKSLADCGFIIRTFRKVELTDTMKCPSFGN